MSTDKLVIWITPNERHVWYVRRLWDLSINLKIQEKSIDDVEELNQVMWFSPENALPTCNDIIGHIKKIEKSDISFPIIYSSEGKVMDGMHRIVKLKLKGVSNIKFVQFKVTPQPDEILKL